MWRIYIYKGKKFNAWKETVQNETYLGLLIFRFYIKCMRCLAEITFKTDPENTDYTMEHGATRNFQAEKLLKEEEKCVPKEREDEELNNPIKVLENRTKDSKLETEVLENLQDLKDLNQRQAHMDFEAMLRQHRLSQEQRQPQQQEEDERATAALLEEARPSKASGGLGLRGWCSTFPTTGSGKTQPHSYPRQGTKDQEEGRGPVQQSTVGRRGGTKEDKDPEANGGSEQTPGASSLSQLCACGDSKDSDS